MHKYIAFGLICSFFAGLVSPVMAAESLELKEPDAQNEVQID